MLPMLVVNYMWRLMLDSSTADNNTSFTSLRNQGILTAFIILPFFLSIRVRTRTKDGVNNSTHIVDQGLRSTVIDSTKCNARGT